MTRPASLQGRLVALVLGMVLLVWAAAAALTWVDARHELDELLDSHLAQAAALLVVQQADLDDDGLLDAPTLHRYAPKVAFLVFHEGELVLRSANAPAWPVVGAGTGFERGFRTVAVAGADWRVFAAQGAKRDVQVYVGERMDSRNSILRAVLRSAAWPMLLALPLLGLAVWWAVARGVAPLRRLGRTLAGRAADDLQAVALGDAPSEMAPMVGALNGLFARIAALLDSERRFTADAAHELRTPIAAIRAQAQVALAETDDERRRHALRNTLAGCDRGTRPVDQPPPGRLQVHRQLDEEGGRPPGHVGAGTACGQLDEVRQVAGAELTEHRASGLQRVGPGPGAGAGGAGHRSRPAPSTVALPTTRSPS